MWNTLELSGFFICQGVKTESGFVVRSVETAVGRWMLVVAVISVDAYPFLAFSDLACYLGVFWLLYAGW